MIFPATGVLSTADSPDHWKLPLPVEIHRSSRKEISVMEAICLSLYLNLNLTLAIRGTKVSFTCSPIFGVQRFEI